MITLNLNDVPTPVHVGDTVVLRNGDAHVVSRAERATRGQIYPFVISHGGRGPDSYTTTGRRWSGEVNVYDIVAVKPAQPEGKFKPGQELTFMQAAEYVEKHGNNKGLQYFSVPYSKWLGCMPSPAVSKGVAYRVAPQKTQSINGREYPAPEKDVLVQGTYYWTIVFTAETAISSYSWSDDSFDRIMLKRGFVHLTKEAAQAHFDAIVGANDDQTD